METKSPSKNVLILKLIKKIKLKVDIVLLIITISVWTCTKTLEAQNSQKIDSLEHVLSTDIDTKERYSTLARLWGASINSDISKSMNYADAIIALGLKVKTDSITYYGYERKAVTHSYKNEFDASGVYFRKALSYYTENEAYSKIAGVQRNIGQDHNMLQSLDSAYYYYDLAEKNFSKANDTVGVADIYNSKAIVNLQKGYFNIGLDYGIKSAKIYEAKNNQLDLHQTYLPIASCYSYMKDTIKALEYYNKTAVFFKNNDYLRQYASSLVLISGLYNTSKSVDKGLTTIDSAIEISKSLKDFSRLSSGYSVKSNLLLTKGDFKNAMLYNDKALEISVLNKENYSICDNNFGKAKIYLELKDYNNAILYGNRALDLAKSMTLTEVEMNIQLLLSNSYDGINKNKAALEAYKAYQIISKDFYNSENSRQLEELKIIYETEKKEKELALQNTEIELLKEQEKVSETRQLLLGIGIISVLALGGLLFYGIKQKMKRNKVEREKLDNSLQFKEKELTTHALHLAHKNEVLLDLKGQLKELKKESPNSRSYQNVINTINLDINNDNNWEQFKTYFEDVHKDFNSTVMKSYPEVSTNDLRLMSLLKMNLSSKEIANILNISIEGVKKARYRLRKKLNLNTEESLQALVIEL